MTANTSSRRVSCRRTRGRTSPLEPDWLLQRHLARDVEGAIAVVRGRLLDVGCGGRPYEKLVAPEVRYVGVDAFASARTSPDTWASATQLPFRDGAFDAVVCTQVIEHLPRASAAVEEMARVLCAGGTLILSAPQTWCLHEAPHDYFRFTRYGLARICSDAGLEPATIRAQGGFWAVAGISLITYLGATLAWAASKVRGGQAVGGAPPSPRLRRLLAPLRLPMALFNLVFAALDALPQSGEFAVNHLVVARKRSGSIEGAGA